MRLSDVSDAAGEIAGDVSEATRQGVRDVSEKAESAWREAFADGGVPEAIGAVNDRAETAWQDAAGRASETAHGAARGAGQLAHDTGYLGARGLVGIADEAANAVDLGITGVDRVAGGHRTMSDGPAGRAVDAARSHVDRIFEPSARLRAIGDAVEENAPAVVGTLAAPVVGASAPLAVLGAVAGAASGTGRQLEEAQADGIVTLREGVGIAVAGVGDLALEPAGQSLKALSRLGRVPREEVVERIAGGAYRDLRRVAAAGEEVHHMPPVSAFGDAAGRVLDGAAVILRREDHKDTASFGSSRDARTYQAEQRALVSAGRYAEAFERDAQDLVDKFGHRYDSAIAEARAHAAKEGWL